MCILPGLVMLDLGIGSGLVGEGEELFVAARSIPNTLSRLTPPLVL